MEYAAGSADAERLREELRRLAGFEVRPDAGVSVNRSRWPARRIVRFAFEYAKANRRRTITLGHKAGIMRTGCSCGPRGRTRSTRRRGLRGHADRSPHRRVGSAAGEVRRPPAPQPLRRHPLRPVRGPRGRPRADPGGEHRLGVRGVRAGARERAGHRGPRRRQPDRDDPVRAMLLRQLGELAAAARGAGGRRGARGGRRAHSDLGGSASTTELAEAVAAAVDATSDMGS